MQERKSTSEKAKRTSYILPLIVLPITRVEVITDFTCQELAIYDGFIRLSACQLRSFFLGEALENTKSSGQGADNGIEVRFVEEGDSRAQK